MTDRYNNCFVHQRALLYGARDGVTFLEKKDVPSLALALLPPINLSSNLLLVIRVEGTESLMQ
jgi:hypothetical protein